MENFFDIATPQELELILGEDDPDLPESMRGYAFKKKRALEKPDYNYGLLSTLYANRGDMRLAQKYAKLIKDADAYTTQQLCLCELVM
jgi:hypothetical protein